jgi:hypothetical protein
MAIWYGFATRRHAPRRLLSKFPLLVRVVRGYRRFGHMARCVRIWRPVSSAPQGHAGFISADMVRVA